MSLTKLSIKMLTVKFAKPDKPVTSLLLDFLRPFNNLLESKKLKVEVVEVNKIPRWAKTDWSLYFEVLYHLVQNASKFN